MISFSRRPLAVVLLFLLGLAGALAQEREPLLVFGAASLADALQRVGDAYTQSTGTPVKFSFAASSALAKQIESGAQADVFMSADQEWMDYLDRQQLLKPGTRQSLLGNRLALIAPADSKVSIKLGPNAPIGAALGDKGRLATGDPDSVPVGKYAKAALTSLQLWDSLQARIARAENVRAALTYVARGEAPLGIVYATDAAIEPKVRIVDLFPDSSHTPITYPVAATKMAKAASDSFVSFLRSEAALATFKAAGFTIVNAQGTAATDPCSGFQYDVSEELKLFAGSPRKIVAAASTDAPPTLEARQLYEVALTEQSKVRFGEPPTKPTVNEGSYAGMVRIAASSAKTIRIALNEPAWIDVLDGRRNLDSSRHAGSHNCKLVRKSVEFSVEPGHALIVQLSGSTEKSLRIAVTR